MFEQRTTAQHRTVSSNTVLAVMPTRSPLEAVHATLLVRSSGNRYTVEKASMLALPQTLLPLHTMMALIFTPTTCSTSSKHMAPKELSLLPALILIKALLMTRASLGLQSSLAWLLRDIKSPATLGRTRISVLLPRSRGTTRWSGMK